MSRVGKTPITIPAGVRVQIKDSLVKATGPLGELQLTIPPEVKVEQQGEVLVLSTTVAIAEAPNVNALHGMARSRVANVVSGVHAGFKKMLEIRGLGYKAQVSGQKLVLNVGLSHPVEFDVPKGVKVESDKKATKLTISGIDKDLVGQTAARIRRIKPPEPYKGKGIRYDGERVQRKAGKTAAGPGGVGAKK
ncbi:MAG: 50S ribosomal protein L6 [Elusimicrobiota bacterium]